MNKKLVLLVLLSLGIMSGCVSKIETVPVYMEEETVVCDTCKEDQTVDILCAKEVKVVTYRDNCNYSCGFPVTVRKHSTCKYGGGM